MLIAISAKIATGKVAAGKREVACHFVHGVVSSVSATRSATEIAVPVVLMGSEKAVMTAAYWHPLFNHTRERPLAIAVSFPLSENTDGYCSNR
jgi:hypothetical protein